MREVPGVVKTDVPADSGAQLQNAKTMRKITALIIAVALSVSTAVASQPQPVPQQGQAQLQLQQQETNQVLQVGFYEYLQTYLQNYFAPDLSTSAVSASSSDAFSGSVSGSSSGSSAVTGDQTVEAKPYSTSQIEDNRSIVYNTRYPKTRAPLPVSGFTGESVPAPLPANPGVPGNVASAEAEARATYSPDSTYSVRVGDVDLQVFLDHRVKAFRSFRSGSDSIPSCRTQFCPVPVDQLGYVTARPHRGHEGNVPFSALRAAVLEHLNGSYRGLVASHGVPSTTLGVDTQARPIGISAPVGILLGIATAGVTPSIGSADTRTRVVGSVECGFWLTPDPQGLHQ